MRLVLHQDRPGELAEPGATDRLEKAIRELQHQVRRSTLPKLPGDGEVKALAELHEHVAELYKARLGGLRRDVIAAAFGRDHAVAKGGGPYVGPRGGLWADPQHKVHWTGSSGVIPMALHPKIGAHPFTAHVADAGNGEVRVSQHEDTTYGVKMPRASLEHFVNDLHGRVHLPRHGTNPKIDAVVSGKAEFLGKGDDGLAFKVGDSVVKVSTTVPYQPFNPGHRTPEGAADMLRAQVEVGNHLADHGVPVLRSTFERHGDKGFQIKPYIEIPEKFTRAQLDELQAGLHRMHDLGYALNDDVQAGIYQGKPMMYDTGKAAPMPPAGGQGIYAEPKSSQDRDMTRLAYLYRAADEPFVNSRDPAGKRAWTRASEMVLALQRVTDAATIPGRAVRAKRLVDEALAIRTKEAQATLTGGDLKYELESIDIDGEMAREDIAAIEAKHAPAPAAKAP